MPDSITKLMFDDSVRILEEIGVECHNQDIINSFNSTYLAGFDPHTNRIHVLRDLVKVCLDSLPKKSKFPVPERSFGTGGIAAYLNQAGEYINPVLDIHTAEAAKMSEEFNLPFMFRPVGGKLTPTQEIKQINVMRKYYSGYLYIRAETTQGINRAKAENKISGKICTTHSIINSPLKVNDIGKNIDLFYETIRKGIPVYLTTMPMTCTTGPASLYGIGILAFAEYLFGMCLAQILNPGIIVVNGAYPAATDPRTYYSPVLGSIYHNLTNHTIAKISEEQDIPSIQSGCTTSNKYHEPEEGGTDFETERGYKLWNSWSDWHQVRHAVGFVNQLIAFDINKMRKDCNALQKIINNNEKYKETISELTYDPEAFGVINECSEIRNFKDHSHTLKNIGILV